MKDFSIVIPVYNEEVLLAPQVSKMVGKIRELRLPVNFEILLVDNGSKDNTRQVAAKLVKKYKQIKYFHLSQPSYGQAFKEGVRKAANEYIYQFDIDFWNINFISKSQKLLEKYDFVIGSKNLNSSKDDRSLVRKSISRLLEKVIEFRFNTRLTDTHGLKALKKSVVIGLLSEVECDNHFLDSELLLRAASYGYSFAELPVSLKELRTSRFPFYLRFVEVIKEFSHLMSIKIYKAKSVQYVIPNESRWLAKRIISGEAEGSSNFTIRRLFNFMTFR